MPEPENTLKIQRDAIALLIAGQQRKSGIPTVRDIKAAEAVMEVCARAWDEGASDGLWNHEHQYMIASGTRTAIPNPFRRLETP